MYAKGITKKAQKKEALKLILIMTYGNNNDKKATIQWQCAKHMTEGKNCKPQFEDCLDLGWLEDGCKIKRAKLFYNMNTKSELSIECQIDNKLGKSSSIHNMVNNCNEDNNNVRMTEYP